MLVEVAPDVFPAIVTDFSVLGKVRGASASESSRVVMISLSPAVP